MTEVYELYLWTKCHESPIQSNKSGLNLYHFDATVIYRKRIKDKLPKIWTFNSPLRWPLTLKELDIWHNASIFHKTLFMRKYLIYPWNQQKKYFPRSNHASSLKITTAALCFQEFKIYIWNWILVHFHKSSFITISFKPFESHLNCNKNKREKTSMSSDNIDH